MELGETPNMKPLVEDEKLTRLYQERFFRKMIRNYRTVLLNRGLTNLEVEISHSENNPNEIEFYLYNWEWLDKREGYYMIINGFKNISDIEEFFNKIVTENIVNEINISKEDYEQKLALKK